MNPLDLLVCDVDDTVLGDEASLRELASELRARPNLRFVLSSSRPCRSVRASLQDLELDPPLRLDALVGALGTEIEGAEELSAAWAEHHRAFHREPVDELARACDLRPHDGEFQTPRKASYRAPDPDRRERFLRELQVLGPAYRAQPFAELDVDVFPATAGKGAATRFLVEAWQLSPRAVAGAGDSENDLELLAACACRIVVGNARDRLRREVRRPAYFAEAARAAGVLEGLRHFERLPHLPEESP